MEIPKPHQVQRSLHQIPPRSYIRGQAELHWDPMRSTKASSEHDSAHPIYSEYVDHQRCQANGETSGILGGMAHSLHCELAKESHCNPPRIVHQRPRRKKQSGASEIDNPYRHVLKEHWAISHFGNLEIPICGVQNCTDLWTSHKGGLLMFTPRSDLSNITFRISGCPKSTG